MIAFVNKLSGARAEEARQAYNSMVDQLGADTATNPDTIRDAIREEGVEEDLQKLCLLLLDAAGMSSQGVRASRRVKRISQRIAAEHPEPKRGLAHVIMQLLPGFKKQEQKRNAA